ncbi:MAG: glycoside hydrolase family 2 TIM barrel-domain containing protein [Acetatifactor sp.]
MDISLEGTWNVTLGDGTTGKMYLPGTLDENGIGHKDTGTNQWHPDAELGNAVGEVEADAPIATRFTRKHTFEGEARLTRKIRFDVPQGKRLFLEAERARALRLLVDEQEFPPLYPPSISSPYVFELTELTGGEHEVTLLSDNSYPGMPHDAIVYSSAATDETQTNWNGILGYLRLRTENEVFLSEVNVFPEEKMLRVRVCISATHSFKGILRLESEALKEPIRMCVEGEAGTLEAETRVALAEHVRLWDEEEGNLYEMKAVLSREEQADKRLFRKEKDLPESASCGQEILSEKKVSFGVRTFGDNGQGRLALNGRTIFLRSEANCCEFPETGHPPMTVEEWEEILKRYRAYGVNCMRFHSHCPPEAAFTAADRLGMLMQPELSHWNPRDAFETEESFQYYMGELDGILRMLANHPSFVMLTFGNELHATEKGHARMDELLRYARTRDNTRLYANGSNVHYGDKGCDENSDFYTSQSCREVKIRGTFAEMQGYINHEYPGAAHNYDSAMEKIRREYKKPVFSFEVGQFEVLPDFGELEAFQGISDPANLRLIQKKVRERGLEEVWERYVEATGELSRIGYREEIEAAIRTKELSGISLLGLQDFPGQGTALVGMMNSHLQPKPYAFAKPEKFRAFFRESLPLVLLGKYTYETSETLRADILVANFGKQEIAGELFWELRAVQTGGKRVGEKQGSLGMIHCPQGTHTLAGKLEIPLEFVKSATRFDLNVQVGGTENTYPVWVYPPVKPVCPENVYETKVFDEKAKEVLRRGGCIYLTPDADKEHLPVSIRAQFTTDFWSVGTFAGQEGGMGQLIETKHPIFREFPTEFHTNWQWWPMAGQRAVILPRRMQCIVTEMDSYAYLRPMAQLVEFRCLGGRVLLSSMGLQNLQQYPEARALLSGIYGYLSEGNLSQITQELAPEEVQALVKP